MKLYKDIIAIIYEHGYKSLAMNLDKPEYEEDITILGNGKSSRKETDRVR